MNKKLAYIASDHAGFSIKADTTDYLQQMGVEVHDLGPSSEDRVDYPDFADKVCLKVTENSNALGVLICGSGQGMAMRANKYPPIRAALCWDGKSARLSREHNDANVLCLGARLLEKDTIHNILQSFFTAEFEGGRHSTRVSKISSPTQE